MSRSVIRVGCAVLGALLDMRMPACMRVLWCARSRRSASWPATPCPALCLPHASCHVLPNYRCPPSLSPWLLDNVAAAGCSRRQNTFSTTVVPMPQVCPWCARLAMLRHSTANGMSGNVGTPQLKNQDIIKQPPCASVRRLDDRVDAHRTCTCAIVMQAAVVANNAAVMMWA